MKVLLNVIFQNEDIDAADMSTLEEVMKSVKSGDLDK